MAPNLLCNTSGSCNRNVMNCLDDSCTIEDVIEKRADISNSLEKAPSFYKRLKKILNQSYGWAYKRMTNNTKEFVNEVREFVRIHQGGRLQMLGSRWKTCFTFRSTKP